ncbi:TetR/AcrR family transcriptional regulator [Amycolatopsis benzoatilytica]|uniref:TetR/AcrR family transcriptional regulator n=1 Tax=Amycolatopsis benzoatilytica TaxID=346045 RepID=UPI0003A245EC|nr:TetR/AcrR family transcriptional regulator [Amycolatopsis benzoatilytica]
MSTRDQLVASTQDLLWERGYIGTSPKAIQQRAGAGQGSMYHHFAGKADLALAAIRQSAEELRASAEASLAEGSTAIEQISAYLHRERDVLRGCPIGRLALDPDIVTSAELRAPLEETFDWLRSRLAEVLAEGAAKGELSAHLDPAATATALVAVVQGGYVLARSAGTAEPFDQAVRGALALLGA